MRRIATTLCALLLTACAADDELGPVEGGSSSGAVEDGTGSSGGLGGHPACPSAISDLPTPAEFAAMAYTAWANGDVEIGNPICSGWDWSVEPEPVIVAACIGEAVQRILVAPDFCNSVDPLCQAVVVGMRDGDVPYDVGQPSVDKQALSLDASECAADGLPWNECPWERVAPLVTWAESIDCG